MSDPAAPSPDVAEAPRTGGVGSLLLDPSLLLDLASLLERPGVGGAPADLGAVPALRWLMGVVRPQRIARVGLDGGAALDALVRGAERLGPETSVLAAPWSEGEPGVEARHVALRHAGAVRLVEGVGAARAEAGQATLDLLSLAAGDGPAALAEWRGALAPGGVVALDAPVGPTAVAALSEALGPGTAVVALGGVAMAVLGVGDARLSALAHVVDDASVSAPLSALLGRLGRALLAEARSSTEPQDDPHEALRRARDAAGSRLAEVTRAQGQALAALREAEALRGTLDRLAREREEEAVVVRRVLAERERELHEARRRVAELEAQAQQLSGRLDERFAEIAVLTRDRLKADAAP